ncbi:MAG TPA: GNAT family N-acetyltransferase [Mycobacterium sp.]
MGIDARPAAKADIAALSQTLGRAFYDDPVWTWMLPDDKSRVARMAAYFAASTRHHHLAGGGVEVACDGPVVGAAALWDPPGRWRASPWAQLRTLPGVIRGFGLRSLGARRVEELLNAVHPEEPHWYLAVLGSDPTVRGKGFGQAVMRSRLDRVDREHAPAYLESSKLANVPYYQRFGFEVIGETALPGGGPTLWRMWREPR